jgi:glyoxylase-like metal-dependent hydrolase (beta-lactamase superfamily II)
VKEIADRIYVETDFALVTVGAVLTDVGWVCIDTPPYPRDAHTWLTLLQDISALPVQYVINTDHHRDRILGNVWFEAPVVAHTRAAEAMLALRNAFISQAAEDMSANDNELVEIASLKPVPPQISFSHSLQIECGGREFSLSHHPGATLGSLWIALQDEQVLFAGDTVVTDQHPVITEASSKDWLNTLRSLRHDRFNDWIVIPGRGKIAGVAATEQLSEYLRVARRRVTSIVRAGRPRAEVSLIAGDFLEYFPYDSATRDEALRRIKSGLEAIYEELRNSQDDESEPD